VDADGINALYVTWSAIVFFCPGVYGVPKDVVANAAYEALIKLDQALQGSKKRAVSNVRFVNIDVESNQVFVSVFDTRQKNLAASSPQEQYPPEASFSCADGKLKFHSNCEMIVEAYCGGLQQEQVDAIVCSVNSRLDLGGAAAKAIADAAGDQFRQECRQYIDMNGSLPVAEVTHVTAGKLHPSIKFVILASVPAPGKCRDLSTFISALTDTFHKCMLYANDNLRIESVSIPGIGSGEF
jgi:O-acetyl-ADP-ribose deacetylase (regulator of RNase III)